MYGIFIAGCTQVDFSFLGPELCNGRKMVLCVLQRLGARWFPIRIEEAHAQPLGELPAPANGMRNRMAVQRKRSVRLSFWGVEEFGFTAYGNELLSLRLTASTLFGLRLFRRR